MKIKIKESLSKIDDIWHNLIKRYSFTAFVFLPLIEWVFFATLILQNMGAILMLCQLIALVFNLCIIIFLYKCENKNSKYIKNKFVNNNKVYSFILFFFLLISTYYFILSVLIALFFLSAIPKIFIYGTTVHNVLIKLMFQISDFISNILLRIITEYMQIAYYTIYGFYILIYNSIKLLWAIFVTFMMSLEPFFV